MYFDPVPVSLCPFQTPNGTPREHIYRESGAAIAGGSGWEERKGVIEVGQPGKRGKA